MATKEQYDHLYEDYITLKREAENLRDDLKASYAAILGLHERLETCLEQLQQRPQVQENVT